MKEPLKQKINIETWNRKNHFLFYKDFVDPCFNICSNIDVTTAVDYSKSNKKSIFYTLLYLSNKASNQVKAFKLRIDNNQTVWLFEEIHPSATVLKPDDTFNFCYFRNSDNLNTFIAESEKSAKIAKEELPLSKDRFAKESHSNQIYYSVIPWLAFTSFKHASSGVGLDIPRIVFGKIHQQGDRMMMPVSVEVHHALADGIDIAKYKKCFQDNIEALNIS